VLSEGRGEKVGGCTNRTGPRGGGKKEKCGWVRKHEKGRCTCPEASKTANLLGEGGFEKRRSLFPRKIQRRGRRTLDVSGCTEEVDTKKEELTPQNLSGGTQDERGRRVGGEGGSTGISEKKNEPKTDNTKKAVTTVNDLLGHWKEGGRWGGVPGGGDRGRKGQLATRGLEGKKTGEHDRKVLRGRGKGNILKTALVSVLNRSCR